MEQTESTGAQLWCGGEAVLEISLSSVCIDPALLLQWRLVTSFSHLFLQSLISHITEDLDVIWSLYNFHTPFLLLIHSFITFYLMHFNGCNRC